MPVITKRKITPLPAAQTHINNVPQLTVETTVPSIPTQTKTEVAPPCDTCYDDFDIPMFYNPFSPLFHLIWVIIVIFLIGAALFAILNIVFFSFMGFILFILPKSQRCKNCGRIFNTRKIKDNKCPYCGAEIENEIKAH